MLVLSRRPDETIVIGGNIRVTILKASSGIVRLGIDAPADVAVHREEVEAQIQAEQHCTRTEVPQSNVVQQQSVETGNRWQSTRYRSS